MVQVYDHMEVGREEQIYVLYSIHSLLLNDSALPSNAFQKPSFLVYGTALLFLDTYPSFFIMHLLFFPLLPSFYLHFNLL